jgi:hypothetical protein
MCQFTSLVYDELELYNIYQAIRHQFMITQLHMFIHLATIVFSHNITASPTYEWGEARGEVILERANSEPDTSEDSDETSGASS